MVIDCCYFLNENDLFEIRYNILKDYVDKFIVMESDRTFSGIHKNLNFKHAGLPKVEYHILYADPFYELAKESPNTNYGDPQWVEEFAQKESLKFALQGLSDNDIVCISDVDEIWSPHCLQEVTEGVYKPKQLPYIYYLNQRTDEDWLGWTGTVITKYKNIKDACINHLRTDSMTEYVVIENGGWHFCSLGGKEQKMESWKNPNIDIFQDAVWSRRETNKRKDNSDLPEFILTNELCQKYLL